MVEGSANYVNKPVFKMMFKYMCLVLFITWYQLAECHPASSSVKSLDSMIEKESEAFLAVEAENSSHKNVRDKRTIGFLKQLFPNLSQIVDRKIQQITRFVFRVIGRLVLRGGGGAGAGAGGAGATAGTGGESGGNGGRRISITLPTFPPSTDDEEEEDTATVLPTAADASVSPSSDADQLSSRISEPASSEAAATDSAPAASADSATASDSAVAADSASEVSVTTADPATTSAPATTAAPTTTTAADATKAAPVTNAAPAVGSVTTTTVAAAAAAAATATANAIGSPTTQMPMDSDNTVGTGIVKRTAREVSTNEPSSAKKRSPLTDTDNEVSSDNTLSSNAGDDAQAEVVADEDPRNKRFLFNLRGGSGGGSGNFLFDLIRRGADRAARAAGGFYRVVAGTDPNTLTLAQPLQYPS
ncbi:hypothetical protein ACI65C_004155, partial [Semiaphis heraclei]